MECRFCKKKTPNNNIFELNLRILCFIKDLLKINKDDDLPKLICDICVTKLKAIEKFIRQCEESDAYFRNIITLPIKHEPDLVLSNDCPSETNQGTKVQLTEMEMKYADFYKKFEITNGNKIEKTDGDKILNCSIVLKEEIINDGVDAEEDNIVDDAAHDTSENKKIERKKGKLSRYTPCNCIKTHKKTTKCVKVKKTSKLYECSLCPAKYKCKPLLDSHVKVHEITTVFTCPTCQIVFRTKHALRNHILSYHKEEALKIKLAEKIKIEMKNCQDFSDSQLCPVCGKCFSDRRALSNHLNLHATDNMFKCDVCSASFNTKDKIKTHMTRHLTLKPQPCQHCPKQFKTKGLLKNHVRRVHINSEPKIPCPICNKMLSTNSALKGHLTIHTGEKNLQCVICYKSFRGRTSLSKHLMIHSDERPFTCRFCPKTFKSTDYVKEHERLHTGETPFKCPVCLRGYAQRCNMKSHFKYNHRELNYKQEMERYKTALKQLPK